MGVLVRVSDYIKDKISARAAPTYNNESAWRDLNLGGITATGVYVSPERALAVTAVFACIRVLSETIASLPLMVYQRLDRGKTVARAHYLFNLLHDSPNDTMTSYDYWGSVVAHICLRGNHYSFKEINGAGRVVGLTPLNPANMEVLRESNKLIYRYSTNNGKQEQFTQDEIWHVRGLSTDGILGLSPISIAREAIGLACAEEAYGARLFSNDARPGGVLEVPGFLKEDAAKRLKESWQSAHSGVKNAHKVAVLEGGLTWKAIGFTNEDSQFLESRAFQVQEIARIFRVPTILIGHPDKASTFASAEQFMLSYVIHTIRPWVTLIERSINKHLLTDEDKQIYFAEFKIDGLLRGDTQSRYAAYSSAIQNTWLSPNEVRELENLNPRDGGDNYINPNITDLKQGDSNPVVNDLNKQSSARLEQSLQDIMSGLTNIERSLADHIDDKSTDTVIDKLISLEAKTKEAKTKATIVIDQLAALEIKLVDVNHKLDTAQVISPLKAKPKKTLNKIVRDKTGKLIGLEVTENDG